MADKKPAAKKSTTAARKASGTAKTAPAKSVEKDPAFDGPLGQAFAAVRTPVYAYVGANDLAINAVAGALLAFLMFIGAPRRPWPTPRPR